MGLIPINGINLNVHTEGAGQPLIMLHGIGGDHTQLANLIDRFAKDFRIIAPDCRGHGQSDKPVNYTLQDHINDVLGIMDYYGIQTTFLYGVSMGSYIAQGVAVAAPERIERLILTVPKSNGLTSSAQRLMTEHAQELEGLNQHDRILALLPYMTYDPVLMKDHVAIFETILTQEQFLNANKALAGFDFRKDLGRVKARTLVISGRYDGLNPPPEGELCASLIPGAGFVEMQYSGHAPAYEEPERFMKIVAEFLRG